MLSKILQLGKSLTVMFGSLWEIVFTQFPGSWMLVFCHPSTLWIDPNTPAAVKVIQQNREASVPARDATLRAKATCLQKVSQILAEDINS